MPSEPSPSDNYPTTPRQAWAQALRRQGLSYSQIAEVLGITVHPVYDLCNPDKRRARQRARLERLRAEQDGDGS